MFENRRSTVFINIQAEKFMFFIEKTQSKFRFLENRHAKLICTFNCEKHPKNPVRLTHDRPITLVDTYSSLSKLIQKEIKTSG